tara:strand:+ start:442 stop:591 length:150 start_codon:yes stop_codon:yes gene_type:complete
LIAASDGVWFKEQMADRQQRRREALGANFKMKGAIPHDGGGKAVGAFAT